MWRTKMTSRILNVYRHMDLNLQLYTKPVLFLVQLKQGQLSKLFKISEDHMFSFSLL